MKTWYVLCLSLLLLALTGPVFAQVGDIDDEGALLIVADMGSEGPAGEAPAMEGHTSPEGPPMGMMRSEHMGRPGHWAGFLGLTKEQKAKMRDLHKRTYEETRSLRYDLMEKRIELRRVFLDPKADAAAVMAKEREVRALREKLADAMARMMVEWRGILTPEQLEKLDIMSLGRHSMMRSGMGNRMMGVHGGMGMPGGMMGMHGNMGMHGGDEE